METPAPRRVSFPAAWSWIVSSIRLVAGKPHYWLPAGLLFFASALAVTFVPMAGHWLRGIVGDVLGALLLALAHTQATEQRISLRRALATVGAVLPTLLALAVFQIALFEAVELPLLYAIATPAEFSLYAYAQMNAGTARPAIDLVHSVIGITLGTVFEFAAPLALFYRMRAVQSLRLSAAAFARSPGVYLVFALATALVPHSLAYFGLAGAISFIAIEIALTPCGYFVFRSAFAREESGVAEVADAALGKA